MHQHVQEFQIFLLSIFCLSLDKSDFSSQAVKLSINYFILFSCLVLAISFIRVYSVFYQRKMIAMLSTQISKDMYKYILLQKPSDLTKSKTSTVIDLMTLQLDKLNNALDCFMNIIANSIAFVGIGGTLIRENFVLTSYAVILLLFYYLIVGYPFQELQKKE